MYTPYKMAGTARYGKPTAKKMLTKAQKTLPTHLKEGMIKSGEYGGPIDKKYGNTMAKKKGCKSKYRK